MTVIQVALPIPKRSTFDYLHPPGPLPAGVRVRVPFGPRTLVGIVMGVSENSELETGRLKPVRQVLDDTPVLSGSALKLCNWLSQYYQHPIGDVVQTALPVALRKGEDSAPKPIDFVQLTDKGRNTEPDSLKRAIKQRQLLVELAQQTRQRSELLQRYNTTVIKGLLDKELAEIIQQQPEPADNWREQLTIGPRPQANTQQSLAIAGITLQCGNYASILLEGVTGSGKTEVYLQAIEEVLKKGQQVLVLVPEIGLTPQTVQRFEQRFGIAVGVLHSNLTDNERLLVWQQSRQGELGIVIGTRSAIFTPMQSPGMIIVDEEHDASYKQQDGLRYNARDLATVRAREDNIPLLLGSATPSLETLNNALNKRYLHFQLDDRAGNASHTRQQVLDVRNQPLQYGLAPWTLGRIREHLEQGSQVMLFINRRGFAPALLCHHCGHVEQCLRCNKPFTLHKQLNKLQCHHCASARPVPPRCEQCGSTEMASEGVGTEQLEQGLATLFPDYPAVRIDSDSARGKTRLSELLDSVNQNRYQLLIGTQILSKGHHFPNVTLVVVMDADGALFSADFRAAERLAQLITQLAGRAGRADKAGEMWLQTHHPDHPLLQDLINNGYGHFARLALMERQQAGLPPFRYQALLRAEAHQAREAHDFLACLAHMFGNQPAISIIGPLPALMEKRQGRYRMQLLLQASQRSALQKLLFANLPAIEQLPLARKVRWSLDVDPQDFI